MFSCNNRNYIRNEIMIIVKNVINEIMKKKVIKLIRYNHYEVVVYDFAHLKKWNIQSLFKVYVKIDIKRKICKG